MQEFVVSADQVRASWCIFPDELRSDPWVLFHGTSGVNEAEIDRTGLTWSGHLVSREDASAVVDIFDRLNWAGKESGGFPVLKPFTLGSDFGAGSIKPVFLAATEDRAALYAESDHAGGETARAVRKALSDLHDLAEDKIVFPRRRDGAGLVRAGDVDLSRELARLEPLRRRVDTARQAHGYGLVYAVRVEAADLAGMTYHSAMGISVERVPVGRLIAKAKVRDDLITTGVLSRADGLILLARLDVGVLAALSSRSSACTA